MYVNCLTARTQYLWGTLGTWAVIFCLRASSSLVSPVVNGSKISLHITITTSSTRCLFFLCAVGHHPGRQPSLAHIHGFTALFRFLLLTSVKRPDYQFSYNKPDVATSTRLSNLTTLHKNVQAYTVDVSEPLYDDLYDVYSNLLMQKDDIRDLEFLICTATNRI